VINRKAFFIVPLMVLSASACTEKCRTVVKQRIMMDTIVEITVAENEKSGISMSIEKAFAEISRLEKLTSPVDGRDVKNVNKNAGVMHVKVSDDAFSIIRSAVYYSGLTGGAFDITVAPLMRLWGFVGKGSRKKMRIPAEESIKKVLNCVGYKNIVLDEAKKSVFLKRPCAEINLGGIAKGYIIKKAMEVLRKEGINNAIVNAGGDLIISGNRFGKKWRIGVRDPHNKENIRKKICISGNKCVFTSGNYERCFEVDGKRYHHIFNPKTGYPADAGISSVTVIGDDPVACEALTKAVFILGPGKWKAVADKFKNMKVILYR